MTLRGIDKELAQKLAQLARRERESMNSLILRLLRDNLGLAKARRRNVYHDLDDLAGTWTDAEKRAFEKATGAFAKVEEEIWR